MNEIQIFNNPQFGEIRTVGKHLSIHLNGCKDLFDEYDMLAMASRFDIDKFKEIVKILDAVVPVENDTYFALRCEVYQAKVAWEIQAGNAINEDKRMTYLMRDKETGSTKIGRSINPPKREKTLQSEKKEISLLMVCEKDVEKILHKKYACKRIRGEWFNLSDRDIDSIVKQFKFKRYGE